LGGGVQLWDLSGGSLCGQLRDHEDVVSGVVHSADGTRLLSCGWDRTARLYSVDQVTGAVLSTGGTYAWQVGRLVTAAVAPDGTLAAAGGNEEPYLVVWDID